MSDEGWSERKFWFFTTLNWTVWACCMYAIWRVFFA